jgi:large subunit ribosomal protein L29
MRMQELKEMSAEELISKETELTDQIFKLRFQKSLGQLDNPMKIKNIKRDIARIKTLLKVMSEKTE